MPRNYFEQEPWEKALECLSTQPLGDIAEISIFGTYPDSLFEKGEKLWRSRMSALLGDPVRVDELRDNSVVSLLFRHPNKAIVRMFFDKNASGRCENFEIVTKNALLIWKPDVHPQGRINGSVDLTQAWSVDLQKGASHG
jgi:hypothetical protein